jgi:hypothetical protein
MSCRAEAAAWPSAPVRTSVAVVSPGLAGAPAARLQRRVKSPERLSRRQKPGLGDQSFGHGGNWL